MTKYGPPKPLFVPWYKAVARLTDKEIDTLIDRSVLASMSRWHAWVLHLAGYTPKVQEELPYNGRGTRRYGPQYQKNRKLFYAFHYAILRLTTTDRENLVANGTLGRWAVDDYNNV